MTAPVKRLLTRTEVAALLGVCTTTISRYVSAGLLPVARTPGGQMRFWPQDLAPFLLPTTRNPDAAAS